MVVDPSSHSGGEIEHMVKIKEREYLASRRRNLHISDCRLFLAGLSINPNIRTVGLCDPPITDSHAITGPLLVMFAKEKLLGLLILAPRKYRTDVHSH